MAMGLGTVGRSHKNIDFSSYFGRIFSHSELLETEQSASCSTEDIGT